MRVGSKIFSIFLSVCLAINTIMPHMVYAAEGVDSVQEIGCEQGNLIHSLQYARENASAIKEEMNKYWQEENVYHSYLT